MGYDLHITRKVNWSDQGNDITSDEWLSLVTGDSELHLDPDNGPFFVIWSGTSDLTSPWLNWSDGQISTKNPDDALIDKMVAIAQKLGAKVQGDEGEIYHSSKDAHRDVKTIYRLSIKFDLLTRRLENWLTHPFSKHHPQMKRGEILPAAEMKQKYGLTIENYNPPRLNPENVPEQLRDLLPLVQKWGIADDIIRDDLHDKVSNEEKQALKLALNGRVQTINQWLDSFGRGLMTEEAAAFMYMLEGLDVWDVGTGPLSHEIFIAIC